jgi:hypothetical protein
VELFNQLRKLGIGACGTARKDVTDPVFGNGVLEAWKPKWGTLWSKMDGKIDKSGDIGCGVLVSAWQDSAVVKFCSTIHYGTEWTVQERKKPKDTSSNSVVTKAPFISFDLPIDQAPGRKKKDPIDYIHH